MPELPSNFYTQIVPDVVLTEVAVNSVPVQILDNVLSQSQCEMIINLYNNSNPVHVSEDGYSKDYRDNYRSMHKNSTLADYIYNRVAPFIIDKKIIVNISSQRKGIENESLFLGEWTIKNINEMFRLCKYEDEGLFKTHCDGYFKLNNENRSYKTLMIYLNSNNAGTTFLGDPNVTIIPKTGSCVIFNHYIPHKGEIVAGEKYIMRSDIMYKKCSDKLLEYKESIRNKAAIEAELGRIAEERGDTDLAVKHYMRAHKIDPSFDL